jgi:hypothetical protein
METRNNKALVNREFELMNKRKHKNGNTLGESLVSKLCEQPKTIHRNKINNKKELKRQKKYSRQVCERSNLI